MTHMCTSTTIGENKGRVDSPIVKVIRALMIVGKVEIDMGLDVA